MQLARDTTSYLFRQFTPFGQVMLAFGILALVASAAMSWSFGVSIGKTHALFLVVVTGATALLPHALHHVFAISKAAAVAIAVICLPPLLVIEYYAHAGYTAGLRGVDIGNAKVQQAKYTTSYDAVDEDKKAMAKAIADRDALKKAHPWAATTTADALRADLPAIEVALKREANNCGRKKCSKPDEGKGPAWQTLAKQKAEIEAKIAIAEDDNKYAIRIAELEKRASSHREKATSTEFKHSAAAHQSEMLSKVVAMLWEGSLTPTEFQAEAADQSVNMAMALGATGLPGLLLFVAGFFLIGYRHPETNGRPGASEPAPTQMTKLRSSFRDSYNRHCRTYGVAPVAA